MTVFPKASVPFNVTVTPAIPASPASWTPLPLISSQTKSPIFDKHVFTTTPTVAVVVQPEALLTVSV